MDYSQYRKEVYKTTQKLVDVDLIRISSGNVSMRTEDGNVALTPSSIPYDELKDSQIVILDMDGNVIEGELKPSVEKMLHINAYKARADIRAVIHTHAIFAITFSLVGMEIPPLSLEMAALGAPIPVLDYVLPGTTALAEAVAAFFRNSPAKKAVLLENHGAVVVGGSLKEAFQNAYNLETGAEVYHKALQTGKKIRILSEAELEMIKTVYAPKK
jgi:L-ribulose-5-phosphate 4-epimerase